MIDWSKVEEYLETCEDEAMDVYCYVTIEEDSAYTYRRCVVDVERIYLDYGELMIEGSVDGYREEFPLSSVIQGEEELFQEVMEEICLMS